MRTQQLFIFLLLLVVAAVAYSTKHKQPEIVNTNAPDGSGYEETIAEETLHPLTIQALRDGNYPGSAITIEETLSSTLSYNRYLVSYKSEGLKIYALLTVPKGDSPEKGWPAVIFNHGYIPPTQYRTTEKYVAYIDGFARAGYVVFKPDYRGHGSSEGEATGGYGSNAYTIDVLNAVASIKQNPFVNPNKIGMWGHSMGGHLTLRAMVASKDVKAGVVWAGVVASYPDLLNNWRRRRTSPPPLPSGARRWRQALVEQFGSPEQNPQFWDSTSAQSFLADISGPIQLHHGTSDASVPHEFSENLARLMKEKGQSVELYTYSGDDHNLSRNFNTAMRRSVIFFDTYLKGD